MNTLVALGTGAAFSYSVVATAAPRLVTAGGAHAGHAAPPVYFEAAAGIVVLVLFGKLLETGARARTSSALRALAKLQVKTARGNPVTRKVLRYQLRDLAVSRLGGGS